MTAADAPARVDSPPTDRVVAVLEFIATEAEPVSVAAMASRLELSRSTVTSILAALSKAGWVSRQPDRRYRLGPGLLRLAGAVQSQLTPSEAFSHVLAELADRVGCAVSLALVDQTEMTMVGVAAGPGQVPAGVDTGARLPMTAPLGVSVMAYRNKQSQHDWIDTAPAAHRPVLQALLRQVRRSGVAVFGADGAALEILEVVGEVVGLLAEHPRSGALRQRLFQFLSRLSARPYTTEELAADAALSISYLSAPVFDRGGNAVYELQIGCLRSQVSRAERDEYVREIRSTAATLTELTGT
ncbi:IclR family transcriptional regulator [Mycobacterium sp. SMC-18]|uniref:IclR family transcriptional regulator n=1 Tax=Mycobacteriaceae TaxID=1762 RepID=UPI001BB3F70B|nr:MULTISPECIES: helix-turn-helix domain-containing protein [unclassified Mycolicibacterium]BCI80532.1 putative transcriptional regulator, IclR family protein [Mycolicibacterium sp. TY66]BCJ81806.1 putative transcriptional regulator, IclR family protein [Mycolicibacterium sp. TY81]